MMTDDEISKLCKELVDAPNKQRVEEILKDVKTIFAVFCNDNAKLIQDNEDIKRSTIKVQVSIERINDDGYKQKHYQEWLGFIDDLGEALSKLLQK